MTISSISRSRLYLLLLLCLFYPKLHAQNPAEGKAIAYDPAFLALVPKDAKIEVLANSFVWAEGPVWVKEGHFLLFSDPRQNKIFKWSEKEGLSVYLSPSGYTGHGFYSDEPGSNGLLINKKGELVACEQGDRRISRMALSGGGKYTITDHSADGGFNSPNDICQHPSGAYYFTDPPYGFQGMPNDPTQTTKLFGVYRCGTNGKTQCIIRNLERPNGIAFSPDGKTLYISQTSANAYITAYPVLKNGLVGKGRIFFDFRPLKTAADGMKVDANGNLYTGAGNGIMVISPSGKLLGKIETGVPTANCAFGEDGWLYITAGKYVCRIRNTAKLNIP